MPAYDSPRTEPQRTVTLPGHLVSRIEDRLEYSEFEQPEEWISYALEEVLARVEATDDDPRSAVSEAEIEQRLESLGYLDR